ncbi:MAG: hypothetical protein ACE5H3_04795, partial [Planctomycetota bacterium]
AKLGKLVLPARWKSLNHWEQTGEMVLEDPQHGHIPGRWISRDFVECTPVQMETVLKGLPPVDPPRSVPLPQDARLLLVWERSSGGIQFHDAVFQEFKPGTPFLEKSVTAVWEDPSTLGSSTRSAPPEDRQSWVTPWPYGADGNSDLAGPGFGGFLAQGGAWFAHGGVPRLGPDDSTGWLNVARDDLGNLTFWFD